MRGYRQGEALPHPGEPQDAWRSTVIESVGTAIEFWGFKRNQGRVWAALYLEGRPFTAAEIQERLDLSKGAVSMVTRELEQWHVVRRLRIPGHPAWHFQAEQDFLGMIGHVIKERELALVRTVRQDMEAALAAARQDKSADPETIERVERMAHLALLMERAVQAFLKTARLDVRPVARTLDAKVRSTMHGARGALSQARRALRGRQAVLARIPDPDNGEHT